MDSILTTVIAVILQILAAVYFGGKLVNRLETSETRLTQIEESISHWQSESVTIRAVEVKLDNMQSEMTRIRNRLDLFIDGHTFQRLPK